MASFLFFACTYVLPAQQETPPPTQGQQDSQSTPGQDSPDSQSNPNTDRPVTSSLDTGQSVDGHDRALSPMRVGHFSLLSFSTSYIYDSNYSLDPKNPSGSNAYAARTLLLYSIGGDRSGLDIQYQPYLFVFQGDQQQVSANLDNRLGIHAFRNLNDRWVFDLDETFSYSPNTGNQIGPTATANFVTNSVNLIPYMGVGYQGLYNLLIASFTDHLSAQDRISFRADYNYADLSNPYTSSSGSSSPTSVQGFHTSSAIGGGIAWTHEWREDHDIGLTYNYNYQALFNANAKEQYHSFLVTYDQRIRPTLQMRLSAGPSFQIPGNGSRKTTTVVGNASLVKSFRRSSLLLSFVRDYFAGVPTDGYSDRYDAYYSQNVGQRWILSAGGGYIRQNSTIAPRLSGRNVWGSVEYYLTSNWGVVLQLADVAQAGGLVPDASRYLISAGLRWSAIPEHATQP
jgi:hypothetical protein